MEYCASLAHARKVRVALLHLNVRRYRHLPVLNLVVSTAATLRSVLTGIVAVSGAKVCQAVPMVHAVWELASALK